MTKELLTSFDEALEIVLSSVRRLETERAGIINIPGRTLAEDVLADNELMIPEGSLIGPTEMGLLAALGKQGVAVTRRPRVSVVTTGDELVDLMEKLEPGKVRNSNRYSLAGHVFSAGCELGRLLYAEDNPAVVKRAIESCRASDAIITTGGVSSCDGKYVFEVLNQIGEVRFSAVTIEPGNTTSFAIVAGKPVFALPGDPEGAAVAFELFVRTALFTMLGRKNISRPIVPVTLGEDFAHIIGRRGFIHAIAGFEDGRLVARRSNGPSLHKSISDSNSLVVIPEEKGAMRAGETAQAMLLGAFVGC